MEHVAQKRTTSTHLEARAVVAARDAGIRELARVGALTARTRAMMDKFTFAGRSARVVALARGMLRGAGAPPRPAPPRLGRPVARRPMRRTPRRAPARLTAASSAGSGADGPSPSPEPASAPVGARGEVLS